jgi:hypothetical protein
LDLAAARCYAIKNHTAKGIQAMKKTFSFLLFLLLAMGLLLVSAKAAPADDDPPGRVARLSYVQGSVSFQPSGENDWVQANPNRPLTTGDNLWADKESRAEVHVGSTAIRLSSETGISFLNLDDRTVQLQLAQGAIEVHLRHLVAGDAFEVDTPNLSFTLTRAGEYRIETDPNANSTVIIVREGEGQVTGGGESYDLQPGQQYTFSGTDQLTYEASEAPGFDDFEDWCQSRDQRENNSISAHYVSRDVDGSYDLDDYGDWQTDSDYGNVWVPRQVAVGWAPYHFGHWVWISPWGWTWVEDEPWGFAPFHYGRWVFVRGYWGWVPGPIVVRPVYAPAVVGFVGGRFGLSVSFGGGFAGVGWFPLGPHDVFVPGYRSSPRYVQNINITNTRVVNVAQITNVYNNDNVTKVNYTYANHPGAVTVVSRETFVNARNVSKEAVRVTPDQVQRARAVESAPLAPTRLSYISSETRRVNAKPPVPFSQRPVVAKMSPSATVNSGRTQVYTNETKPFNHPPSGPGNNAGTPANTSGFRPFTPPGGDNRPSDASSKGSEPQARPTPSVRFTPPVKAKDEMYDVHPPLNQKQGQAPKQQEHHSAPPPKPKPESHTEQHH